MHYLTDGKTLWEVVSVGATWVTVIDAADRDPRTPRRTLGKAPPGMREVLPASDEETAAWWGRWLAAQVETVVAACAGG